MTKNKTTFRITEERRRILLVEDEIINQEILKESLADTYDIILVQTGEEALEIIREQHETISVVLLDLFLPGISGIDVLRKIKDNPVYSHLPVIVTTSDYEAEVECLTYGAIDFISKPYPPSEVVLARIRRTVELSEDRDTLHWAERDHLTGLYNKEFFYHYAMQLDLYHKGMETDAVVIDVNHFHTINDRYGKARGDEVLMHIARSLQKNILDAGGIVCRREADTFMLYCPHRTDYEMLLNNLAFTVEDEESGESHIWVRMGVYSNVDKSLDIEFRFDRAKMAADTVKGNLANPIGYYDDSMHDAEVFTEQLIDDFHTAIREKQFDIYYQPKYNIHRDEPVLSSAEALVRWKHPKLGMVSPGVFIPLFEDNGLIQELDHYVWSQAAAQVRDWKERLHLSVPVSVNISRIDLYDPDLVENLLKLVRVNRLEKEELILEITESAYTENSKLIIERIEHLHQLGFKIEMDDFGSGYSSLSMLSTMPIDALKLDMQFIRNAFKVRKDTRLLEIMIKLADAFELLTIAEGVETAEQVFTLKQLGCDVIQGYYFSRPLPADEFERFITTEKRVRPVNWKVDGKSTPHDDYSYDALHDALTGLYNYSAFYVLFRDSDKDHIAILIADVDDYDNIKQQKGKPYADKLICRVADVIKSNFRSVDFICRLTENEFVVIITRVTKANKETVFSKIEKINNMLKTQWEDIEPVELTVGIAFSDKTNPDADVFKDAETAQQRMKEIKNSGYSVY
jgi:diguanylate cyclase (GGDEF)-like protein